ncbi:MAG: hypothetical protein WC614_13485 [bacterium]
MDKQKVISEKTIKRLRTERKQFAENSYKRGEKDGKAFAEGTGYEELLIYNKQAEIVREGYTEDIRIDEVEENIAEYETDEDPVNRDSYYRGWLNAIVEVLELI